MWPGLFMSVCLDNFAYVPFENICSFQNVTIATEGLLFLDIDILTPICMAEQRQSRDTGPRFLWSHIVAFLRQRSATDLHYLSLKQIVTDPLPKAR